MNNNYNNELFIAICIQFYWFEPYDFATNMKFLFARLRKILLEFCKSSDSQTRYIFENVGLLF